VSAPLEFKSLFEKEQDLLCEAGESWPAQSEIDAETPGPAGEPWIRYTPANRVGLAFSGGGIRSATFNLGVLKALHELGVLKHVDYLSTVSGGGYVGAWWSAWRARWGKEFPEAVPTSELGTNIRQSDMNREPAEVRHLREFSNFLSPRIGFFQSEMWNAIMAVLSAVLPAILVATSVIAVALLVWLGVNSLLLADALKMPLPFRCLDWLNVPLFLSALTVIVYYVFESAWFRDHKAERLQSKKWRTRFVIFHLGMPLLLVIGIWVGWHYLALALGKIPRPPGDAALWQWSTGIAPDGWAFSFSPYLFAAPLLWAGLALVLLVPRILVMRLCQVNFSSRLVSALDRALSRLLASAIVIAALGALWLAGCWLNYTRWGIETPAGGALLSGGAFALLRNWMAKLGPGKKGGVMDLVKPLIPQILAYVAIALWAIFVATLLAKWIAGGTPPWCLFFLFFGTILFAVFFFDPAQVSMHSFYRNRLARAYLGASNLEAGALGGTDAGKNRQTDVRKRDDIELRALSPNDAELRADREKLPAEDRVYSALNTTAASRVRPIHLVCCAANDLGGDHLENLSRGSRSAVLSKFGFAIGNHWKPWENDPAQETLGLASAITASAAAFNSNMGSLSMSLGAGVVFLCTALNLRLGLWLRHPLTPGDGAPKLAPGWLFFKEMFGVTKCGLRPIAKNPTPVARHVHLSDGAHFENLALYELVRRHCRYIIVSDCGADAEVAFDDFGNAVRRIREDFGVEIDIDLSPLMPNEARISKQHVAVGIISYDPRGDRKDNAILLYFKPALTGDEPCDIAQYRTRNEAFPHEATGDQFYDEAQWESYRRLGEHATYAALRFVERERRKEELSADTIFNSARWEWYLTPARRAEKILELTGRLAVLEQQLRQDAPPRFVREMYPELGFFNPEKSGPGPAPVETSREGITDAGAKKTEPAESPTDATSQEISKTLHFLTQMIQLMEDVWFGSELEEHWNDPNNLGWINTFQRWAYTPSFRLWWPILKPMYGRKFRRFMEERLSLADEDYPETRVKVIELPKSDPRQKRGVAEVYWRRMYGVEPSEEEKAKKGYAFDLMLTHQKDESDSPFHVQAGLAFLDISAKPVARWNVEDLFVPPSLWGAGLGAVFLKALLDQLQADGYNRCEVTVEKPPEKPKEPADNVAVATPWNKRTDIASRQQLNDLLAFYQRANFRLDSKNLLVRDLPKVSAAPVQN
jgi:GNAT superfamily N-acetyltransferase